MTPKLLLRIAAGCVLFFAIGHSIGHTTRKDSTEPQAQEVLKAMEGYKFPLGRQLRSYDEFYEGMSLNLIISLVGFTILLWLLSNAATQYPKLCAKMLWPLLFCLVAFTVTGGRYFFVVPAATCAVASVLILWAIIRLRGHSATA